MKKIQRSLAGLLIFSLILSCLGFAPDTEKESYTLQIEGEHLDVIKLDVGEKISDTEYQIAPNTEVKIQIPDNYVGRFSINDTDIAESLSFIMPAEDSVLTADIEEADKEAERLTKPKESSTVIFSSEDEETTLEENAETEEIQTYDPNYLSSLLQNVGVGFADGNRISTYAARPGETVYTTVLDRNVSNVDVVDYENGGIVESWAEGLLGADGEWVFCADPNVSFQSGNKTVYNATQFYNQNTIDTIGCALAWYDQWKTTIGCTYRTQDDYMYKQILIWEVLKEVNGWYPGLTLEFGNNVKCLDGNHYLSDWTWRILQYGIENATDPEWRAQWDCSGVIMKGEGQDVCQFTYVPAKGYVSIQKSSAIPSITDGNACYSLKGAKYGIYQGNTLIDTLVTDKNGKATSKALSVGSYRIKEISAPKGYALDLNSYNVTVSSNHTTTQSLKDYPQSDPVAVLLGKVDAETTQNMPQGSASLAGAEFTVKYYDGFYDTDPAEQDIKSVRSWVIRTEDDGYCRLGDRYKVSGDDFYYTSSGDETLPLGTITIQESKAPEGYLLNDEVFIRQITSDGPAESVDTYNEPEIKEEVIRGDVQIAKYGESNDETEDSGADIKKPLKDIKFHFTSKTTGEVYTIITDEQGIASTTQLGNERGGLPFDTYTVTEESPYPEYDIVAPFDVTISEEGKTLYYILRNDTVDSPISVQKVDSETGEIIPIAGAKFQILDENKKVISMVVTHYPSLVEQDTWETDATGSFVLPEKLEHGVYYLREIQAPEGYLLNKEDIKFTVEKEQQWEDPLTITFPDNPAKGKIRIQKTDAETGDVLQGAEFTITATEDIKTGDGTIRVPAGQTAATVISDENGIAETTDLYLGKYEIKEIKAPAGYALSNKTWEVELKYKDQNTAVVINETDIKNKPTTIIVDKKVAGSDDRIAGVKFALWNKDMLTDENDPNFGQKEILVTGEDGTAKVQYLLPGMYCLQEVETVPGYVLNDTIYEFTVDENGRINGNDSHTVTVENKKTEIVATNALNTATKNQEAEPGKETIVEDTVSMLNLQPGKTYVLKAVLMDSLTGQPVTTDILLLGDEIAAEKEFTATSSKMDVVNTLKFDSSKFGTRKVTVYEYLYQDGVLISEHTDIHDEKQQIQFKKIGTLSLSMPDKKGGGIRTVKTGDTGSVLPALISLLAAAGLIGVYEYKRYRRKENEE